MGLPDRRELAGLSAVAVAQRALDDNGWFKPVAEELAARQREECEPAAAVVLEAHRTGRTPAWLVALLLGRCRSPTGYGVCAAIMDSGATHGASSYASHALVEIAGDGARADLVRVVHAGATPRIRQAAFSALRKVGSGGDDVAFVHRALAAGRVRAIDAALWLEDVPFADGVALAWLASEEPRHRQTIVEMASFAFDRGWDHGISGRRARALLVAIDEDRVLGSPEVRRQLSKLVR